MNPSSTLNSNSTSNRYEKLQKESIHDTKHKILKYEGYIHKILKYEGYIHVFPPDEIK